MTPQSVDPAHPFPFISNFSLNLLVTLHYPESEDLLMARVKVPTSSSSIPRFVPLGDQHKYVLLEDVMSNNLDLLFPKMKVEASKSSAFSLEAPTLMLRTTRNKSQASTFILGKVC